MTLSPRGQQKREEYLGDGRSRQYIAYRVTNLVNGKVYIGITTAKLPNRWRGHVRAAEVGSKLSLPRAVRKYGTPAFLVEHIASARNQGDLNDLERILIRQHGSNKPDYGYNRTLGGGGVSGLQVSMETRQKLSNVSKGLKRSLETRRKMSAALSGRVISDIMRMKISASLTGKQHSVQRCLTKSIRMKGQPIHPNSLAAIIGRPCSYETRAKIAATKIGKPRSMEIRIRISATNRAKQRERNSNSEQGVLF